MLLFLRSERQFQDQLSGCWFLNQNKHGNSRGKKNQRCLLFLIQALGWSNHPELDVRSMIPFLCRMEHYRLMTPGEKLALLVLLCYIKCSDSWLIYGHHSTLDILFKCFFFWWFMKPWSEFIQHFTNQLGVKKKISSNELISIEIEPGSLVGQTVLHFLFPVFSSILFHLFHASLSSIFCISKPCHLAFCPLTSNCHFKLSPNGVKKLSSVFHSRKFKIHCHIASHYSWQFPQ